MSQVSPVTELAALLIQNDFVRAEADEQSMRAARENERRAMAEEVRAMHEQADAIVTQAWVQGGIAAAGGAAQCAGSIGEAANTKPAEARVPQTGSRTEQLELAQEETARETRVHEFQALGKGGAGLCMVAEPAGQLLGGVPKADAETDAAQARNASEQADARADEAAEHRARVEKHSDSVLDLAESTLDAEHQGNFAILANF